VLLKLSGEALLRDSRFGIEKAMLESVSREVAKLVDIGVEVAMVIGAGNIFRGACLVEAGIERVTADQIGMLGTIMNALALQDALESHGMTARVMSGIRVNQFCEEYIRRRAVRHLEKGRVVVFGAGIGNPFFTTDTAASLRAIEIDADLLIKATKVDGVFSADPKHFPDAKRYRRLGYDYVLSKRLAVMDATAVVLCRDNDLPLRVIDMSRRDAFLRAVTGKDEGTLVENVPEDAESAI
jgi:uridylate kinase